MTVYAAISAQTPLEREAERLYERARMRSIWTIISNLFGRKPAPLPFVSYGMKPQTTFATGVPPVVDISLIDIRGTVDCLRSLEFDAEFRPIAIHRATGWLNVAAAYLDNVDLGPIKLMKLGERYLVVDGHQRVSVAKALHRRTISAIIIDWEID